MNKMTATTVAPEMHIAVFQEVAIRCTTYQAKACPQNRIEKRLHLIAVHRDARLQNRRRRNMKDIPNTIQKSKGEKHEAIRRT